MRPLDDLLVVDLSRVLAGPYCTMLLADYGARVVKVERPGAGDDSRGFGPPFVGGEAAYFLALNRNKESIALDIADPGGLAALERLAGRADVLCESFRPGVLDRLGLGPAHALAKNPRLVYASISGFGHAGAPGWSARPGYDLVAQGAAGLMSLTGEPGGPPMRAGLPIADLFAGVFAALGVLLALRARERTGRGQHVDVSLQDGMISILSYAAGICFATGAPPARMGNAHPTIAPYETYAARDGAVNVACGNDALFRALCEAVGRADLAGDPRFRTNEARVRNREALAADLRALFAARTVAQCLAALEAAGVPCGPILDVAGALAHPQVAARGMVREIDHPTAGRIRVCGPPVRLADTPGDVRSPPPLLGEHGDAVLRACGTGDGEIARLRAAGVLG